MTIEEKAKRYDEVLEKAKALKEFSTNTEVVGYRDELFPELKESEDERIRKELIDAVQGLWENNKLPTNLPLFATRVDKWIAWLEKHGEKKSQEKCNKDEQKLYLRFGDIPSNEKSKVYRGEEEIGEEGGVSVYPAFEVDGSIVLGLTLPITKTTLHTQQHLLEYDNRPCYLVNGDYIGNDADGQPLINNIHIVKKIDNYRIKEEKSDNVEPKFEVGDTMRTLQEADSNIRSSLPVVVSIDKECYHCTNESIAIKDQDDYEYPPMNKTKFKVGDWVVRKDGQNFCNGSKFARITKIDKEQHWFDCDSWLEKEDIRLWTTQDTKG